MNADALAFHYTTRQALEGIIVDGAVRPTPIDPARGERPVVWFSTMPLWEPSAAKGIECPFTRRARRATLAEMEAVGLARVVADAADLTPWPALAVAAGIASAKVAALERSARSVGALPERWAGFLAPFPLRSARRLEVFHRGAWLRFYTGDDGVLL